MVEPIPKLKPWKNKWIYNKLTFGALTDLYPTGYRVGPFAECQGRSS